MLLRTYFIFQFSRNKLMLFMLFEFVLILQKILMEFPLPDGYSQERKISFVYFLRRKKGFSSEEKKSFLHIVRSETTDYII